MLNFNVTFKLYGQTNPLNEELSSKSSIGSLPREIIFQIFSELRDPYSMARCAKVNNEWNALTNDNRLWKAFDPKWDSIKAKQAKKISVNLDYKIRKLKSEKKSYLLSLESVHIFKNVISEFFNNIPKWGKNSVIVAAMLPPALILHYTFKSPYLINSYANLFFLDKDLKAAEIERITLADPLLAFGTMWKLMQRPELLKKTFEQGLIPKQFIDFVSSHINEYKKSIPISPEYENDFFSHHIDETDDTVYREELVPMRKEFKKLQKEFYRTYVLHKIQNLIEIIIQAEPGTDKLVARNEAIKNLKERYQERSSEFRNYIWANSSNHYNAEMIMNVLSEMS